MIATRRAIVALVYTLGLAGLSAVGLSFFSQLACEGQLLNINFSPVAWGEHIVSQSFIAPRNRLNRVDISFRTYGHDSPHDITLRLLEVPEGVDNPLDGLERFQTTFNTASLGSREWRIFTFPPIPDSAQRTYLITLQSPAAEPGAVIGGIIKDAYAPGSGFLGNFPMPVDLTFRTCYDLTAGEKLQVLFEQMTRQRPAFWGQISFYLLALFGYSLLLIGFFWKLTRLVLS